MGQIGIMKRGLEFMPSNPSPLSNPDYKPKQDKHGYAASMDKQIVSDRRVSRHHRKGKNDENDENDESIRDFENYARDVCNKDISDYSSDGDGEQDDIPSEFLDILRTFTLFKQAPQSFLTKIASQLKFMAYNSEEYVIKKGEASESMYWILKGTVGISDGESIRAELAPGSFFGEIGIMFNRPRTATVVARSKIVVGILTREALNLVLKYYPEIERRIRDEAQDRLAMQEKERKTMIQNANEYIDDTDRRDVELNAYSVSTQESIIKNFSLFQGLPIHIIQELSLCMEIMKLNAYDNVFNKGDKGADIYILVRGRVEVIDTGLDSKADRTVTMLDSGNYLGIVSFLSYLKDNKDPRRCCTVLSVSPVELLIIRRQKLELLCKEYSFIIDELEHECLQRTSLIVDTRKEITPKNTPTRLSINFLMNGKEDNKSDIGSHSESHKHLEAQQQLLSYPIFNSEYTEVQPISPISPIENIDLTSPQSQTLITTREETVPKKRKISIGKESSHVLDARDTKSPIQDDNRNASGQKYNKISKNKRVRLTNVEDFLMIKGEAPIGKVLLMVFEYLTVPELMKLRIVCKLWGKIVSTASNLCKKLDLTPWNTSIDDKSLIEITDFVGGRPRSIDISNCFHVTDEGFTYMVNEIGISGKIINLKMKSNWEISGMAIMDLSVRSVGAHLEEIDLSNCRKVRDNVLERLTGWDLKESNRTRNDMEFKDQMTTDGVGCKSLKTINVGYCKHLTDNIMYHISKNANTRLENLDLTRCTTITDQGFEYWNNRYFPNLKKLSLKDCTFLTDKSIISIANAANNLEILDLKFCCALSDVSIDMLCLGCPRLKHLDLSFCGSAVSDFSLATISLHLRFLERLILKGCIRATRAGIDSLLSGCSPLKYINVSQCKNAHVYPGGIPAEKLNIHSQTKTAFVTAGSYLDVIEIVV